ncbi:MAG: phage virion morphogenesis protein [Deltaproteobacteria bacterium]|nr:phage virion morphogenesis protein [Deltaproteobacteria bacterium]
MIRVGVISKGDAGIKAALERLRTGVPTAMKAAAAAMHGEVVEAFRAQRSPFGEAWAPHSPVTLKLRGQGGLFAGREGGPKKRGAKAAARFLSGAKKLIDKGTLLSSLSPQSTARTASVTSALPYASVQNFGAQSNRLPNRSGGNLAPIPARPFMMAKREGGREKTVLPDALKAEIIEMIRVELLRGL